MKQLFIFILFIGSLAFANGQDTIKPLLVREVYDFEVGDLFQYEHITEYFFKGQTKKYHSYSQVKTLKKKIVKDTIFYENEITEKDLVGNIKTYVAQDTILYKDSSIFYGLPSFIPIGQENNFSNKNTIYKNEQNFNPGNILCQNSVGQKTGLGGRLIYVRRFMKGLGRVYWYFNNYADPIDGGGEIYTTIISHYKKGNKTYGNSVDFTTTLNDKSEGTKITIYPNPTSGILFINGMEESTDNLLYEFYDISGKKIKQGNILSDMNIDVVNIAKGLYFIKLFNPKSKLFLFQQKIIIH